MTKYKWDIPTNKDKIIGWQGKRIIALEDELATLKVAVAWEREFDEVLVWLVRTGRYPRDMASRYDLANERECARAEVDRLIADCKGEE